MSNPVVINGQGGVNLLADSTGLALNETMIAKNVFPNTPGTFGTRKVMSFLEPLVVQTVFSAAQTGAAIPQWGAFGPGTFGGIRAFGQSTCPGVSGIAVVNVTNAANVVGSQAGDNLWLFGDFFGYGYNLSTVLLQARGANPYCICNVGQRTLVLDGTSSGYVICKRSDAIAGEPLIDLFGSGTIPSGLPDAPDDVVIQRLRLLGVQDNELQPLFAVVRGNRLVFGAPDAAHPNTTFWGDPIDQISFDAWRTVGDDIVGSRSFVIGTDAEGGLTAMWAASISPDASQPQTAAYMFKPSSLYMSTGEPGYSTDFGTGSGPGTINGTLQITRLNTSAGCIAADTVVWTPSGMVWAGPDDVWMMGVGQLPHRVGTKIQPMLKAQPVSLRYRMHAVFHEGAYKLAMFSDGQGPTETSPCLEQWWLDLRDETPPQIASARWWGPQVYAPAFSLAGGGTYAMCLDARPGYESTLLAPQIALVAQGFNTSVSDAEIPVLTSFEAFGSFDSVLPTLDYDNWVASTAYVVGQTVRPSGTAGSGREFVVAVAGTSGLTEPLWDDLSGSGPATAVDGTVTWIARAYTADGGDSLVPWTWLGASLQTGFCLFDIRSREFSEPDAKKEKLLDGLDLVWKASQPLSMDVTLLPDQETSEIATILQQTQPNAGSDPMPLTLTSKWGKRFLPPKSDRRSRAPTFQVRLTQRADFMVPWHLRYFTFFTSAAPTTWRAYPIVGGGDTLVGSGATYTGTASLDPNHAPVALASAILAASYPAGVLAGLGLPATFVPNDGVSQSTPGQYGYGSGGGGDNTAIPWDATAFGGYDPSLIPDAFLVSNRFWLSLMGFGASLLTDGSGDPSIGTYALPGSAPAIVVIKEFSPRVRVFNRSPT